MDVKLQFSRIFCILQFSHVAYGRDRYPFGSLLRQLSRKDIEIPEESAEIEGKCVSYWEYFNAQESSVPILMSDQSGKWSIVGLEILQEFDG